MMSKKCDKIPSPIRVSMIEPVGGHGGNEFYDFGLCEALGKYCAVSFYTCNETCLHEKYNLKTKTYKFYKNIYGDSNLTIRGFRYLYAVIKTVIHSKWRHSDIIHVHIYHFAWSELLAVFLARIFLIRVVATIHDVESFSENPGKLSSELKCIKFYPFIDRYIVHSQYAYENLNSISKNTIKDRLTIVSHGDTDFLYPGGLKKIDVRNDLKIAADKKVILFFGQIKQVKGLDVLLDAFAGLSKKDAALHLLIVGRPWKVDGQLVRSKISELGIEHQVSLHMTYIDNEDVPKYFVAADIIVLPYLKIYSSGVLLRALDYGTPVIVSDLSPLTDIIHDGKNGRVFRSGDSAHLESVIHGIINDSLLLARYAHEGKKTVAERYSWDVVARETISVYRSI